MPGCLHVSIILSHYQQVNECLYKRTSKFDFKRRWFAQSLQTYYLMRIISDRFSIIMVRKLIVSLNTRTHARMHAHARMHTHTHTHLHTHMHTHTHTHTLTRTHSRRRTHTHTHAHTHTQRKTVNGSERGGGGAEGGAREMSDLSDDVLHPINQYDYIRVKG